MFGAGIGVGMLTRAVAEPVAHFGRNPKVIQGLVVAGLLISAGTSAIQT
tara:strand:+ start:3255 stop:3401 length:147 start_codon:yes stop_codon:yes gene_type:complete